MRKAGEPAYLTSVLREGAEAAQQELGEIRGLAFGSVSSVSCERDYGSEKRK